MNTIPNQCPICGGEVTVTRIYCRECDTTIDGHFAGHPFAQLKPEQLSFVETFIRCEGRIKRMEEELNLSYPTIRKQLQDVIRALGYEPPSEEPETAGITEARRKSILEDLEQGRISYQEAMRLLQENEA
jgi:hypothetical protein